MKLLVALLVLSLPVVYNLTQQDIIDDAVTQTCRVLNIDTEQCGFVYGNTAFAEKCEDITGKESWSSEGHGDNNPSEKQFNKMLNDDTVGICELAEDIDHMKVKGSVDDWSDFKETTVYMGSSENVQDCLKDRFDLPDDGHKELQAYEILDCGVGKY